MVDMESVVGANGATQGFSPDSFAGVLILEGFIACQRFFSTKVALPTLEGCRPRSDQLCVQLVRFFRPATSVRSHAQRIFAGTQPALARADRLLRQTLRRPGSPLEDAAELVDHVAPCVRVQADPAQDRSKVAGYRTDLVLGQLPAG